MSETMEDWATGHIKGLTKDFNGDPLSVGDHVMFALGRGVLAEGIVSSVGIGSVTITSSRDPSRTVQIDSDGAIKTV